MRLRRSAELASGFSGVGTIEDRPSKSRSVSWKSGSRQGKILGSGKESNGYGSLSEYSPKEPGTGSGGASSSEIGPGRGPYHQGALSPLALPGPGRHSFHASPTSASGNARGEDSVESMETSPVVSASYGHGMAQTLPRAGHLQRRQSDRKDREGHHPDDLHALSEAALDVARAVERIERSRSRRREEKAGKEKKRRKEALANSGKGKGKARLDGMMEEDEGEGDDEDGEGEGMRDSFLSDRSSASDGGTRTGGRWMSTSNQSSPKAAISRLSSSGVEARGRHREKRTDGLLSPGLVGGEEGEEGVSSITLRETAREKEKSRSRSVIRGPKGKAAGVIFMGTWMLFGIGTKGGGYAGGSRGDLSRIDRGTVLDSPVFWQYSRAAAGDGGVSRLRDTVIMSSNLENKTHHDGQDGHDKHDDGHYNNEMIKRTIGRISAWICTTLYLTSRLPQIWKNVSVFSGICCARAELIFLIQYQRKSVEGLSILLFFFAFNGNLTYVLSILLNPAGSEGNNPETRTYYLLEALPYLLGSGGTLVFDLTIMFQSLFYGAVPPVPETTLSHSHSQSLTRSLSHSQHRSRSNVRTGSRSHGKVVDEESQPLLLSRGRSTNRNKSRLLPDDKGAEEYEDR